MGCPSNSNWCVLNVIWQTGFWICVNFWICVAVAIFAAQVLRETEEDFLKAYNYRDLPMALIAIGFLFDSIVCIVEYFMVAETLMKLDGKPELLYCVESLLRFGFYCLSYFRFMGMLSEKLDVSVLVYWIIYRLILSAFMCCITKKIMDDADRRVNSKNVAGQNNAWGNARSPRNHSNGERKFIVICFILNYCVKVCKMK